MGKEDRLIAIVKIVEEKGAVSYIELEKYLNVSNKLFSGHKMLFD
jgi:Mn-dependent DtxR family transcriptional regulator